MHIDPCITSQRLKRDIALAVFFISSLAFGVADLLLYRNSSWTSTSWILNAIVGIIAIVSWCRYDSQVQGFVMNGSLRLIIWLLAAVGVPMYLVRSRGWRRAARVGFGIPAFVLSVALYYAGWYSSFWLAGKMGYFQS